MNNENISFYNTSLDMNNISVLHHLMYQESGSCSMAQLSDSVGVFLSASPRAVISELERKGYIELENEDVHLTDFGLEYYEHIPFCR